MGEERTTSGNGDILARFFRDTPPIKRRAVQEPSGFIGQIQHSLFGIRISESEIEFKSSQKNKIGN